MHFEGGERTVVLKHRVEGMLDLQLAPVVTKLVFGVPIEQQQKVLDLAYGLLKFW